ncbi:MULTISPECIES: S-layer homology domain-containing protein [Cyanophyceae]|uniref:S-layer homology domain-containing protein n=1 Tax=Cyanophyceae TaxID=3028117 RepID=UPI001683FCEF|nr:MULTISPECIES: S-layer homology domain-containing protein [Cyanophyceae]MBD1917755.1 S-layer homology domain-containing protein [Phormidium sp. FACHB-77]MBD2032874.1 S-layer homology domain-containing protein [Phormidium sp. FACHB-322]MBD2051621.1 S-layer homology domain-containing protein [Leptolyngbya sp. FACHB-60]
MVNLPPDPPNPSDASRRVVDTAPRARRTLEPDELLAVVLAFLGIGSILWWGLTRSQGLLADPDLLSRRVGEPSSLTQAEPDGAGEAFEPRTFERDERTRQDPPAGATRPPSFGPEDRRSSVVSRESTSGVVLPVNPNEAPSDPSTEVIESTQPLDISAVPTTHWAYPFIKPMFDEGYLPDFPESNFQPDQPVTRAELAAFLNQAFGDVPREGSVRAFVDVPSNYWAAPAINSAVSQGFMNGYPEGDFRPDQAVPRYEVLVSLASGLGLADSPAPDQTLQAFVDLNSLPDWARPKVAAAADNALVVNYPNRDQLKPAQAATRAEIVAMIHQALVQQGELPRVESEYTVP